MDKKEIIIDILILIIATAIGLEIVLIYQSTISMVLFLAIEVLVFIYIIKTHKNCQYFCTECGTKYKLGIITDLESLTKDNGDKVVKCKKCKKKTIFRRI